MLKTILFFLLKTFGFIAVLIAIGVGYFIFKSKGSVGYHVDWSGVKYYYKENGHEQFTWNTRKLKGVDKSTFMSFGIYYAKDNHQVYFKGKVIEGADPIGFEHKLFDDFRFSKDAQNVYYEDTKISEDAAHFEQINKFFFKDRFSVYKLVQKVKPKYLGESDIIRIADANPHAFKLIPEVGGLWQDDKSVYFRTNLVKGAVPGNLKKMDGCWTDGSGVFHHEKILEGANLHTFRTLQYPYFTDGKKVYYESNLIEGANPETFQFIPKTSEYAKDDDQVFFLSNALPKADVMTIEKISYRHWKDKNRVFYEDKILLDANPNTFSLLMGSHKRVSDFGKDDRFVYYKNKKLESADPATFGISGKDKYGGAEWSDGENKYDKYGKKR